MTQTTHTLRLIDEYLTQGGNAHGIDADTLDREARLVAAAPDLLKAAVYALADLEGVMPDFEPSGLRKHPAWMTIKDLHAAITKATGA